MAMPSPVLSRSRRVGLLCLLVTVVGWGLNWPVMKFLLGEWPPLFARGTAGMAAALALALFALLRGASLGCQRAPPGASSSPRG
jgi:drug/metabolite transporter (DMT)-like permease